MTTLKCLTRGSPAHPPLIFLHGFLGDKEDWEAWFPFFEEDHYCIALDLPGHGSSPYTDEIVTHVRKEIFEICQRTPSCIGYSMGGRIAMQMQDVFSWIACLSSHPGLKFTPEKKERWITDCTWADKLNTLDFKIFLEEWYSQGIFASLKDNPALLSDILSKRSTQDPKIMSEVLLQMSLSQQEMISEFSTPTALFYGKKDCKYEKLYGSIRGNIVVRSVPDAGHAIHLENAADCARQIREIFYGSDT